MNIAYGVFLIGVSVLSAWWVIFLQPDDFPWQPVTAGVGLAVVVVLIVRARRGAR